jgi:tripartite-type tricarboxylate transporter receptor subunit TctC
MVPKNSRFKSLDQFVAEAKANPGKITVAGVGSTGKMNMGDLANILGIKHAYVPVSGGVGKMIPRLLGNHVDAGMTASSHATKHKMKLNTLAVAGPSEVGTLPGIPNVEKWGYMTTWKVRQLQECLTSFYAWSHAKKRSFQHQRGCPTASESFSQRLPRQAHRHA